MNKRVISSQIILILFICLLLFQCAENPDIIDPPVDDPYTISLVSGGNQSGLNGEILIQPIVVQLMDANNLPVMDAKIKFSVLKGWGNTDREIEITNMDGKVKIHWTIGPGPQNMLHASYISKSNNSYAVVIYAQTNLELDSSWTSNITFFDAFSKRVPHDNRILETQNIWTFSDGSSDSIKIEFTEFSEIAFAELKQLFDISHNDQFQNPYL